MTDSFLISQPAQSIITIPAPRPPVYIQPEPVALAAFILTAPFLASSIVGCGGGPLFGNLSSAPSSYTLSVSPQLAAIPVSSTVTFTAATNAPSKEVIWVLVGINGTTTTPPADAGSPTLQSGGTSFAYTAPAVPPIYGPYGNPVLPAGTVDLRTVAGGTNVETKFTITAPSITTGFYTPASTSVALGGMLTINAYAVGSTNNAITLQVNGINGGSTSVGTIAAPANSYYGVYIYTAPSAMPMTGNTITITVISRDDPTKSSNLTLMLY